MRSKRYLSLFEVILALALATILLSTLFSTFRYLTKQNTFIETLRREKHWEYVTQLRLNQIFESIRSDAVFRTESYNNTPALHFSFQNGIDPNPSFCGELEGYLLFSEEAFSLLIQSKKGPSRTEFFLKSPQNFSIKFFHPEQKKWFNDWQEKYLPSMVKISLQQQKFFFFLPHADRGIYCK